MRNALSVLILSLSMMLPVPAEAAELPAVTLGEGDVYTKSLRALTMLFVVAVLLENAFAIIFNWRIFLTYFSLRGVKTPIMIIVSFIIVTLFDLDILAALINAYQAPPGNASGFMSSFVTALILAGGSAGVHNIMSTLGYRDQRTVEEVEKRPPGNAAWLAVTVTLKTGTVGPAIVHRGGPMPPRGDGTDPLPIAGTVSFRRPSVLALMLRNNNRFPQNGGYTLQPNQLYEVWVTAETDQGAIVKVQAGGGPLVLAPGAIVNLSVTL